MLVNNTKATLQHLNGLTLKPGVNTVDIEKWRVCRKHKSVKKKLGRGDIIEETEIEELEDGSGDFHADENVGDAYSEQDYSYLGAINQSQARNVIKETFDTKLLSVWFERETRNQIKGAIKKQIEIMSVPLDERDRNQTRQIVTGKGPEIIELKANPSSIDD